MRLPAIRLFKPPIGTPIDWGSTLTSNLMFFYPFWEGGASTTAVDVVNGMVATRSGTLASSSWSPGTYGVGLKFGGASDSYAVSGSIPTSLQPAWPITIAIGFRLTVINGAILNLF